MWMECGAVNGDNVFCVYAIGQATLDCTHPSVREGPWFESRVLPTTIVPVSVEGYKHNDYLKLLVPSSKLERNDIINAPKKVTEQS